MLLEHIRAEFTDPEELRQTIIDNVHCLRKWCQQGVVADFSAQDYDGEIVGIAGIGSGSLGGKALGLAFTAGLLKKSPALLSQFPDVRRSIPHMLVITTGRLSRLCGKEQPARAQDLSR